MVVVTSSSYAKDLGEMDGWMCFPLTPPLYKDPILSVQFAKHLFTTRGCGHCITRVVGVGSLSVNFDRGGGARRSKL